MLTRIGERQMHLVRWILTTGWLLLIVSLFFDPVSSWFTEPGNTMSPLKIDPEGCIRFQDSCLPEIPHAMGVPLFWGLIVPSGVFILLVFGHEYWRRICPLSFLSQIPRALGWQRQRKRVNAKTGKVRYELAKVTKDSWLARNALYVQLGLFFLGLCIRILFVNSSRLALGTFLIATILAAIAVGYIYGGKSWCHYFCPMAPVQKIYAEPRAIFNSMAHDGDRQKITQSMCRTVNKEGQEQSACVACHSPCMDIDAEHSYWENVTKPERQLLYYGYVGITIGFFVYFYLYSGTWSYGSGIWEHQENQLETLFQPGFYLLGEAIPIPKLVAVPLTLALFTFGGYLTGKFFEKRYKAAQMRKGQPLSTELIRHRMFTLATFFIFNFFYVFAGKNYISLFPRFIQYLFPVLIASSSSLWLYRTWQRSPDIYLREGLASRLRKQLQKLNLDTSRFLEGRSLTELSADEVYVLAKVLPKFDQEKKLQTYKGVLREALDDGYVTAVDSFTSFQQMRTELDISDSEHEAIIVELGQERPDLFDPQKTHSRENLLRLKNYRETLLETILESWQDNPEKTQVAELMQAFATNPSELALEELLRNLSPEDLKIVETIRQQYGITDADERDALRRTDKEKLWKAIAEETGWLDNIDCPEKLLELFNRFDVDNSGYINLEELQLCLRDVESSFTDSQIQHMLEVADTSGDDQISYYEFCQIFAVIGCASAAEVLSQLETQSNARSRSRISTSR
ncbi:MAG: EF-hand domain-containing protein [Cyanobacteria bacterium P01_A01_bin.83]